LSITAVLVTGRAVYQIRQVTKSPVCYQPKQYKIVQIIQFHNKLQHLQPNKNMQ